MLASQHEATCDKFITLECDVNRGLIKNVFSESTLEVYHMMIICATSAIKRGYEACHGLVFPGSLIPNDFQEEIIWFWCSTLLSAFFSHSHLTLIDVEQWVSCVSIADELLPKQQF